MLIFYSEIKHDHFRILYILKKLKVTFHYNSYLSNMYEKWVKSSNTGIVYVSTHLSICLHHCQISENPYLKEQSKVKARAGLQIGTVIEAINQLESLSYTLIENIIA